MGVVSPFVTTYASFSPYLTKTEFLNTPTALEVTDLIPGGTQGQQDQALRDAIDRASSWADSLVHQVLAATLDFNRGRYSAKGGLIKVPLKYKPVLEITSISIGARLSAMTAFASTDFGDVTIMDHGIVEIPAPSYQGQGKVLVDIGYVNGWPNTTLSGATLANAVSMTLGRTLGVYPGSVVTIYDGASTEAVLVNSVVGQVATPSAPLVYAHAAGVSVSALPAKVKSAVALLTTALIQTRGDDAIILDAMETPGRASPEYGAAANNVDMAKSLLSELLRVW